MQCKHKEGHRALSRAEIEREVELAREKLPRPLGNELFLYHARGLTYAAWRGGGGASDYRVYSAHWKGGAFPDLAASVGSTLADLSGVGGDVVLFRVAGNNYCGVGPK